MDFFPKRSAFLSDCYYTHFSNAGIAAAADFPVYKRERRHDAIDHARAMTESGAARPSDSQGRNLLHEKPRESLASQTLHPSIEKPMLDGQAEPPPASKLRCGGGERATLGSGGARKYGCDQTRCGGLSVVEQDSPAKTVNRPSGFEGD